MAKFCKQYFINRTTGEKKVYSYTIPVPKRIVDEAGMEECDTKITVQDGKIIIEKNIDKFKIPLIMCI